MKRNTKNAIAFFLAGFFAKDMIDDIFFLVMNKYPLEIFGFTITATAHTIMLVISTILTGWFLYYAIRTRAVMKS